MRPKAFINSNYFLQDNPFPTDAIVRWGEDDARSNGSLFSSEVLGDSWEEAVTKFIVNPVDSGSKFHFLWSLGGGHEARGYGKTATLHNLARTINRDLGYDVLIKHGFAEEEARENAILATMAAFDATRVTTLAAVCLEHVKYLLQDDEQQVPPLRHVRNRLVDMLNKEPNPPFDTTDPDDPKLAETILKRIHEQDLAIRGKTIATADKRFVQHFANNDFNQLRVLVNGTSAKAGYDFLHTVFVLSKAAHVRRIFLLIDEVEAFANADVPRKRRQMEVERFRDLAIETQPFGEMASYILTMHPDAARSVEEFWSLARLPRIDYESNINTRVTVVLRELKKREEVEKLLLPYLEKFRSDAAPPPDKLFPFTTAAIDALRRLSYGRPGQILVNANSLIAEGADRHWLTITEQEVNDFLGQRVLTTPGERRRKIGTIDS